MALFDRRCALVRVRRDPPVIWSAGRGYAPDADKAFVDKHDLCTRLRSRARRPACCHAATDDKNIGCQVQPVLAAHSAAMACGSRAPDA